MISPQQEVARDLCRRFPKMPSLTLAKKAYKENPGVFTTLEAARSNVRYWRGNHGNHCRKYVSSKESARPNGVPHNPISCLPKSKSHFKDWKPVKLNGQLRALILSDIHIPYHDFGALSVAIAHGKKMDCDTVILNGDIADFYAISRWEKDPRKRDFGGEIKAIRQFLTYLRGQFPKARIIYKQGNHEERFESYFMVKAPELLGIDEFEFDQILKLKDTGTELVKDMRPICIGPLNLLHGHEYKFAISNPVNPARGFFLRAMVHCYAGHLHRTSQHSEKNLEEHVTSTWSSGCLCGLRPDYQPHNKWNHGFGVVENDHRNRFHVHNLKILKGKVY